MVGFHVLVGFNNAFQHLNRRCRVNRLGTLSSEFGLLDKACQFCIEIPRHGLDIRIIELPEKKRKP